MGRDSWHKRRKTGGYRVPLRKKRKFELARPAAMTKIGAKRIHTVRTMGGNKKFRALRLDHGNFSWGSECMYFFFFFAPMLQFLVVIGFFLASSSNVLFVHLILLTIFYFNSCYPQGPCIERCVQRF